MEPFLNNGFNLAIWLSVGKTEYFMERLHALEIGFAPSFKTYQKRYQYQQLYLYSHLLITLVQSLLAFENLNLEGSRPKIF